MGDLVPGTNIEMEQKYRHGAYTTSRQKQSETINGLPTDLATRLFSRIQQKRNRLPVRNRIRIDASIQTIQWGKKRVINRELYSMLIESIYNQMKDVTKFVYWGERKALKKYIENIMLKMYVVS
jgi:hypothetical protein